MTACITMSMQALQGNSRLLKALWRHCFTGVAGWLKCTLTWAAGLPCITEAQRSCVELACNEGTHVPWDLCRTPCPQVKIHDQIAGMTCSLIGLLAQHKSTAEHTSTAYLASSDWE